MPYGVCDQELPVEDPMRGGVLLGDTNKPSDVPCAVPSARIEKNTEGNDVTDGVLGAKTQP